MKLKYNFIIAGLAALALTRGAAQEAQKGADAGTLSLEQVVGEVVSNNASLKAARANWEAMKERVPQARAWEDPRAGMDATAGRFVAVPANSFTDYKYSLEQEIPFAGDNRLRAKAAEADAAEAFFELRRRELDLIANARTAYFRLANGTEQLDLNRRNTELLKQFVEITRSKYEVGAKSQSDVLTAETELGKLEEARYDIERQISEEQSQINVLMNRPAESALGPAAPLQFIPFDLPETNLEVMALQHRPELLKAGKIIEAAAARLELAKRGWIPNPALRVEGSRYNQSSQAISEVTVGFSLNLPWFNRRKYSAAIRENKKRVEVAEQELEALQTQTLGLLRDHLRKIETYHHHAELFRSKLIPLAEQSVNTARLSFETDKTGFLNLLEAQRTLQETESEYWNHLTDFLSARAELEAMLGTNPDMKGTPATNHKEHHE